MIQRLSLEENAMPSPFPGMNPYLEQPDTWEDFHQTFLTEMRNRIAAKVSKEYVVKLQAHIYLHEVEIEGRQLIGRADAGLSHASPAESGEGQMAVLETPVLVPLPAVLDEEKSAFIEIRDRERRVLITVVELLSAANKYSGPDREAFLAKRHFLLNGPVNYVELDFMRGGPQMPIPDLPICEYYALVRRTIDRKVAGLWPLSLRDPLPRIPIPLRAPDADITLSLQEIFHTVYDAARYENYIYDGAPQPPLSAADAAWAKPFVPGK
jgi:hypothetical protein